jgi:fructoselysine-6-P-deglycase FrlB-like protein/hydroxymethylpyrimidine pyrophosphatase-like HAD family hydrolase
MGRPYQKELSELAGTFEWSREIDVSELAHFFGAIRQLPLVCVGSGGSLAVASFGAVLHELFCERVSRAATPLDIASNPATRNAAVLFLSASGKHPDVLGSFKCVAETEPQCLAVLCGNENSPLFALVKQYPQAKFISYKLPNTRDGFLATNSVLANAVMILRAFLKAHGAESSLPGFEQLNQPIGLLKLLDELRFETGKLWKYRNILLLHGRGAMPAALDFESRFHEAGLASVHVADLRNFAHGRHYWLAKLHEDTAVLVLASAKDRKLADKTLSLIPKHIVRAKMVASDENPLSAITLFLATIHMAGWAGQYHCVDPGKPHVPQFGRAIYHLNAWKGLHDKEDRALTAVWRKSKKSRLVLSSTPVGQEWRTRRDLFVRNLEQVRFRALVVDYDGTICAPSERFTHPGPLMAQQLNELLRCGIWLGVATGRGKSVKKALRTVLNQDEWGKVIVGYYNGAQTAFLSEDKMPVQRATTGGPVTAFLQVLREEHELGHKIRIDANADQIKIEPQHDADIDEILCWVQHLIATSKLEVHAVVSTRSIDIVKGGTSKRSVIRTITDAVGQNESILCIGDAGAWPGNDFELLGGQHSLSADSTSPRPGTCWNLAPVGIRGCEATLGYLMALDVKKGYARFRTGALESI